MEIIKQKIIALVFFVTIFAVPNFSFAGSSCSKIGYTISAVNGVLTSKKGAEDNQKWLKYYVGDVYLGQTIDYQYLLNPTRYSGVGDAASVLIQKFFQDETVKDYDLVQMFIDASKKVKTQKLLLVAHSQGNFYANSFYDVATKDGNVSRNSLGVYAVASPSNHVADRGNGLWLTSHTDHVISGLVGGTFGRILYPNTNIVQLAGGSDPLSGHGFIDVYLKYRNPEIISDVHESLRRLSNDLGRNPEAQCIVPPPSLMYSLLYKVESNVILAIDTTIEYVPQIPTIAKNTVVLVANGATKIVFFVGDTVGGALFSLGSFVQDTATKVLSGGPVSSEGILASVIDTTQGDAIQTPQTPPDAMGDIVEAQPAITTETPLSPKLAVNSIATTDMEVQEPIFPDAALVLPFVDPIQTSNDSPIAMSFGGGSVAQDQAPAIIIDDTVATDDTVAIDVAENASSTPPLDTATSSVQLSAPVLSVLQCAQSLASSTDNCLLATTTVRFEWSAVVDANHYIINKNGTSATTTETSAEIIVADFSDYTFVVSAVDSSGQISATSTKIISVATIPVAINEIAWMGTAASTNDEWIELKNNTAHVIDLSLWTLVAKDGAPNIVLTGTIAPHEYRVLERGTDTVTSIMAGQIYGNGGSQWALGNTGEQLSLLFASTTIDKTTDGAWTAGYSSTTIKRTMERLDSKIQGNNSLNWGTNDNLIKNGEDSVGNAINGTPGEKNSSGVAPGNQVGDTLAQPATIYGKQINFDKNNNINYVGDFILCNVDKKTAGLIGNNAGLTKYLSSTNWQTRYQESANTGMLVNTNFRFIFAGVTSGLADCKNGTQLSAHSNTFYYTTSSGDSVVYDPASISFITSFETPNISGVVSTIIYSPNVIALAFPRDVAMVPLAPIITVSPGASVSPASGVPQDFSVPVVYTVTALDGSTREYPVTISISGRQINFDKNNNINYVGDFILCNVDKGEASLIGNNARLSTYISGTNWQTRYQAAANTGMLINTNFRFIFGGRTQSFFDCKNKTYVSDYSNNFYYQTSSGSSLVYGIYSPLVKSAAKAVTSFVFSDLSLGAIGSIDSASSTINFTVPPNTNVRALVPIIVLSPFATSSPASLSAQDFTNPVVYTVTAEDGSTQEYIVTVNVEPAPVANPGTVSTSTLSTERAILSFDILIATSTISGILDESAHTVALTVPFGTDIHSLTPQVAVSPVATSSPASLSAQDFTNPVVYTVTAEDGSTQVYTVTVNVEAAPVVIPVVTLPVITDYMFNGVVGDITADFATTTPTVALVLTSNINVDWVSVKIENKDDASKYKTFFSGAECVDGTTQCSKTWDGQLSGEGVVVPGEIYRIKVHTRDDLTNEYNDYLSPYVITIN